MEETELYGQYWTEETVQGRLPNIVAHMQAALPAFRTRAQLMEKLRALALREAKRVRRCKRNLWLKRRGGYVVDQTPPVEAVQHEG